MWLAALLKSPKIIFSVGSYSRDQIKIIFQKYEIWTQKHFLYHDNFLFGPGLYRLLNSFFRPFLAFITSSYWHIFFRLTGGGGIIIFIFGALSFKVLDEMGKLFQGRIFSGPPPPAAPYFSLCTREKHMEQQVFWLKKCFWWNMQHLVFSVLFFSSLWRWHGNIALWLKVWNHSKVVWDCRFYNKLTYLHFT